MVLMPLFGLEVPKRLCDQRARNTNKASKDCSRFRALQVSQSAMPHTGLTNLRDCDDRITISIGGLCYPRAS